MINVLKKNITLIISLLLFGIYLFLNRRFVLTSITLSTDEIYSWNVSMMSWGNLFLEILNNTVPFAYYIILKLWVYVIPTNNDFWIRVPSLFFGIFGVQLLLFHIHEEISKTSAALIGLYLLFDPVFLDLIAFNRAYSLLFLLSVINSLSVYYFVKTDNKVFAQKVFFSSLCVLLFVSNLSMIYFATLMSVLFILRINVFALLKRSTLVLLGLVFISFCSMFLYQFIFNIERISWVSEEVNSFFRGWHLFLTFSLSLAFLRKKVLEKKNREVRFYTLVISLGIIVIFICNYLITPILVDRYLFMFYPYLYLLLAYSVKDAIESSTIISLVSLALILGFVFSNGDLGMKEYSHRSDIKHFMKELKEKEILSGRDDTLCLINNTYSDILVRYSEMHFKRNICRVNKSYDPTIKNIDNEYIIFHDDQNISKDIYVDSYKVIYRFKEKFIVMKKI